MTLKFAGRNADFKLDSLEVLMPILRTVIEALPRDDTTLETYDRSGQMVQKVSGVQLVDFMRRYRTSFRGWGDDTLRDDGRKVVALLFKSEETVEFLVAAFAAISEGCTIVPLYPNWSAETQLEYLEAYRIRAVAVGSGFRSRAESWLNGHVERVVPVTFGADAPVCTGDPSAFTLDVPKDHPCAWIFTSGTSGALSKLTEITLENLEAAVENIQDLDFLHPGMTLHSPLSASHIFAFVAILGFLTVKPRRMIFSDVQYLARLPASRTGKVDGLILVPIVMNRMRSAFYEKLTADLDVRKVPAEVKRLARIPLAVRKLLKRMFLYSEQAMVTYESTGRVDLRGRLTIASLRKIFGPLFSSRLGSPDFVVVGGAKPNLQAMAFLEVMGIRCLQGWGMTETTGPLCVCRLGDRFQGAFGTCGTLFRETNAYIDAGELVVEGPQIAHGYHQPDGSFIAFNGKKRTGDHAEIDSAGRLKVLGKASDRITTDNGINYNPVPFEEKIYALDLEGKNLFEEVVVIGDAKPRLGAVIFLREGVENTRETHAYVKLLLDSYNATRVVDERVANWTISDKPFKEAGVLGPSGKLIRRRVEEHYANIFGPEVVLA